MPYALQHHVFLHLIIKYLRGVPIIIALRKVFLIDSDNASIDTYSIDNKVMARGIFTYVSLRQELSECLCCSEGVRNVV